SAGVRSNGAGRAPGAAALGPGGCRLPIRLSASVIVHGGGRFLQIICRDLSERKRMEHELMQAEKMSTVGVLAAGILPELATPLSYVKSNLGQASQELTGLEDNPRTRALRSEL